MRTGHTLFSRPNTSNRYHAYQAGHFINTK